MDKEDKIIALLEQVSSKLDHLDLRVSDLENKYQSEILNTFSIAADSFDEYCLSSDQQRRELSGKTETVVQMLHTLTTSDTLETLELILEKAPKLAEAVEQLESIPQMVSIAADSFDELFRHAEENGLNLSEFGSNFSSFAIKLLNLFEDGNFNQLLESGVLDKEAIETVGTIGESLSTIAGKTQKMGPFALSATLFNSDFQRAAGFIVAFAETFGSKIKTKKIEV